ncbi:hypothetical protein SLEP1_g10574 [Rubroshorea leprosula]|uniref:Serpin domain-containing protein n=1 Tax=Rubroshorea leprosula TaxID=152421 RepID=A0AAV5IGF5_9ROSI|nr:hypothetical protein SLEP1_g10574 [Rubroshorea leprosula]
MDSSTHKAACTFKTDFCLQMTNHVLLKQAKEGSNFVSSPLSFHVVLSLIAAGSKGHTLEQVLSFLGAETVDSLNHSSAQIINLISPVEETKKRKSPDESPEKGPTLSFVNGAWIDQRFSWKPSFEDVLKEVYKAKFQEVDFARKADEVVDEVNAWVERSTEGLIKQLIPGSSLDKETVLILANALYFKGSWDQRFDPSRTKQRDFHLLNGEIVQAPFMTSKGNEEHFYGSFGGYKILQLPYQSGGDSRKFSMYMFLPDEKDGLPNLIQRFNSDPGFFNQPFRLRKEKLNNLWIPRFKFSFEFEASETMKEMGLELPFLKFGAELTEMVDSPISNKLYISNIFHKSYIEVNEEGTEATASTALSIMSFSLKWFVAEHPFMFMIREETSGLVFFSGAVLNPLLEA